MKIHSIKIFWPKANPKGTFGFLSCSKITSYDLNENGTCVKVIYFQKGHNFAITVAKKKKNNESLLKIQCTT